MGEFSNCPICSAIFIKSGYRDVCDACHKEQEVWFEKVYQYIKKRENRTASVEQIVEVVGVDRDLLFKFIKTGRLKPSIYPNLSYKCEKCGGLTVEGKICDKCKKTLIQDLKNLDIEEGRKKELKDKEHKSTYHVNDYNKRFDN